MFRSGRLRRSEFLFPECISARLCRIRMTTEACPGDLLSFSTPPPPFPTNEYLTRPTPPSLRAGRAGARQARGRRPGPQGGPARCVRVYCSPRAAATVMTQARLGSMHCHRQSLCIPITFSGALRACDLIGLILEEGFTELSSTQRTPPPAFYHVHLPCFSLIPTAWSPYVRGEAPRRISTEGRSQICSICMSACVRA
jgi:hypothetical protein